MSRSSYTDDYGDDYPGQLELYRANVDRSIGGRDGQARLRELRDALVALPQKRLAADVFAPETGDACALGVWARAHAVQDDQRREAIAQFDGNDDDTADLLKPFHWPRLVVLETVYQNDETRYVYESHLGPHRYAWEYRDPRAWPREVGRPETDEERYRRVLAWVNSHIHE